MTTINLNHITKIEGHASLTLKIEDGKVEKCELEAIEGARFFEGMVVGRKWFDIQEITSRICGICSSGHTIACIQAIENGFHIKVSDRAKNIRELLTIAERIRSHATHLYMFALPDYLNYESAIAMAASHKKEVERALRLIKLGNDLSTSIAGRNMHPLTIVVGGISKLPKQSELNDIKKRLEEAIPDAVETIKLFEMLPYPHFERISENASLKKPKGYALHDGNITSQSRDIPENKYFEHISESLEIYATSKFAVKEHKAYRTGALSRLNNNQSQLGGKAGELLKKSKHKFPSNNPFLINFAQAIELLHFIERGIDLISKTKIGDDWEDKVEFKPISGRGVSIVEVPRGMLIHDYVFNDNGEVISANIITPTAQNLRAIEEDLKEYVPKILHKEKDRLVLEIEKLIRSYDPCFSCSTHFLKVKWE